MHQLWHRNTRRYGGYIVHFGVAIVVIGILGTPFNRDIEKDWATAIRCPSCSYELTCRSFTQEENPNYGSEWAIIDVSRQRQGDYDFVSGAPLLQSQPAAADSSTDLSTWKQDLLAGAGPLSGLCRAEP
jgi:cytochrome c biogenesis factor